MEKVLIRIPGAGSLEVENYDVKAVYDSIHSHLIGLVGAKVYQLKRGRKKKVQAPAQ